MELSEGFQEGPTRETNHREMDSLLRGERITQDGESSAEAMISGNEPFSIH
jgi:hypothetical protein